MGEQAYFLDDEEDGDKTSINFNLTEEGLVIDTFGSDGEHLHTEAMTALEWFHWMAEQQERREVKAMYGKDDPALVTRRTRNLVSAFPQISYGPTLRKGFWVVLIDGITTLAYYHGDDAEELAKDTAKRISEAFGGDTPVRDMSYWTG